MQSGTSSVCQKSAGCAVMSRDRTHAVRYSIRTPREASCESFLPRLEKIGCVVPRIQQ